MKLVVSAFACLAAFAAVGAGPVESRHKLEHSLDLAQGPLLDAMFDYQARGYKHFTQSLTPSLNAITLLRNKIHQLSEPEFGYYEKELTEQVDNLTNEVYQLAKNPSPNELLKARGLFFAQIDIFEQAKGFKEGRHEKVVQMVREIVTDEQKLASHTSILSPETLALKEKIAKLYSELEKILANQKIPTVEMIEMFVPFTQKKIDSLKYSPDLIAEAMGWVDVLHKYRTMSYDIAELLPIDSIPKADKYFHDIGEFYKTLFSVYQFDTDREQHH